MNDDDVKFATVVVIASICGAWAVLLVSVIARVLF